MATVLLGKLAPMTDPLFGKAAWKDTELEKDFQERVASVLRMNGWRVYSVPDSRRASLAGYPDLTCWHPKLKRLFFAELKREKGKLSIAQKIALDELNTITTAYLWRPSDWDEIVKVAKGI
jgi:hypothetical protein